MLSFRFKLSLLVIALFPILVGLGTWQLTRYHEKLSLERVYDARRYSTPLSFSDIRSWPDPLYLPLKVTGHYVADKYFFLDNQIYQGKAGYDLLMPFVTLSGEWLLVNRGWLPADNREILPEIFTPEELLTLQGNVYRPLGESFLLEEDRWNPEWPKRIQSLDFSKAEAALGELLPVITLVLSEEQPGAEQVRPISINMKSEKHLAYAFQWFAMALVLIGLYIYRMKRADSVPYKNEKED